MSLSKQINVSGTPTALVAEEEALDIIVQRSASSARPLGVGSINLDHVHHFGNRGSWAGSLGWSIDWLNLIDGAPIAAAAKRITGVAWPRLAGSDLIGPILDRAEDSGIRVGFLGGSKSTLALLRSALARERPELIIAGAWSPSREEITDPHLSKVLAAKVRASQIQLLVVGLGKPRQELWIENFANETGARVLLAFGAVVDFLAGRVKRAPRWVADAGLEWAWRLTLEPRRLARRYLIQGPPALLQLRKASRNKSESPIVAAAVPRSNRLQIQEPGSDTNGVFVVRKKPADVVVVIVTYNSADDVTSLIESLRVEARGIRLRVIVADNDSGDSTLERLSAHNDLSVVSTGGNLGYSGGINVALPLVPPGEHVLVLNPDLKVRPGAIRAMVERLRKSRAGIVAPKIVDPAGDLFLSLRREPSLLRALGDAVFGSRFEGRQASLSDIDRDTSHYCYAHPVDWASGAALMIHKDAVARLGRWDEQFFLYSEEIDYQRRARVAGFQIWYEPAAVVEHRLGGSGVSSELVALMAVNRVRYVEKYHGPVYSAAYRVAVMLHEFARSANLAHRKAFWAVAHRSSWHRLPKPTFRSGGGVTGSIIIPAHNEAAVIGRLLSALGELTRSQELEVIVVCNGTTDETAFIASEFPGVEVAEIPVASKIAALNHGDRLATRWPRLYIDADIEISPTAARAVLCALSDPAEGLEAARPAARYDTSEASFLVRRYYQARSRIASFESALWGAGAYAVSEAGHARFAEFPEVIGDDLYIDRLFPADRKSVIQTEPVVVRTPLNLANLTRILRRNVCANTQHPNDATTGETMSALVRSVRGPASLLDAIVYAGIAVFVRLQVRLMRNQSTRWERDESTR